MRTRAFLQGAAFGYFNQAIIMLAGLWLTPFLLRNLGQGDYGRWLVYLQVLGYAMLADFGTVALLPREIAYAAGSNPEEHSNALTALIGRTARVVLWQTGVVLVITACILLFSFSIPKDFKVPTLIVAAGFVIAFPFRIFSAALEGFQQLRILGQIRTIIWVASTLTTVMSILLGYRIYSLAFGWLVSQIGLSVASYLNLRRLFPWLVTPSAVFRNSKVVWRDLFKGSWISMGQLAQILISGTDLLIVGHVLGPAAVVIYSCTGKLLSVLANQPLIIIHAALPGLSQMKVVESPKRLLLVTGAMGQAMLLMTGAVAILVLTLNEPFVTLWVGGKYFSGLSLTILLILNTLLRQMDLCFVIALFAFGYEKQIALKSLTDGLLSTCVGLLLIRVAGTPGVAGASLLSSLLFALPTSLLLLARECGASPGTVLKTYLPWFWRFALLAFISWKVSTLGWINSYPRAAAAGCTVLAVYALLMSTYLTKSLLWPYIQHLLFRAKRLIPSFRRAAQEAV